jgi:hypothetical protein
MVHRASADFWQDYRAHGSLQFKKIGIREGKEIWSARVTLKYRALAFRESNEYVWFWIGEHNAYDYLIQ